MPNRDLDYQVFGDVFDERLECQPGYFTGVRDGASTDSDNNSGKDFNGRLLALPFHPGLPAQEKAQVATSESC